MSSSPSSSDSTAEPPNSSGADSNDRPLSAGSNSEMPLSPERDRRRRASCRPAPGRRPVAGQIDGRAAGFRIGELQVRGFAQGQLVVVAKGQARAFELERVGTQRDIAGRRRRCPGRRRAAGRRRRSVRRDAAVGGAGHFQVESVQIVEHRADARAALRSTSASAAFGVAVTSAVVEVRRRCRASAGPVGCRCPIALSLRLGRPPMIVLEVLSSDWPSSTSLSRIESGSSSTSANSPSSSAASRSAISRSMSSGLNFQLPPSR